jgi:predicted nucleotidyltransferase
MLIKKELSVMTKKDGCCSLPNIQDAKNFLQQLKDKDKFEKMLFTAAIITEQLEQHGIKPIIVGGLSVEIYTMSGYTTQDLDFVLNGYEQASEILKELEFRKIGKDWVHPILGISLEIPSNTLTGDYEKVTEIPVSGKKVYVIGIEDIILDRLRSAVHWQSGVDREWGYRMLLMYLEDIDLTYIQSNFQHPEEEKEFQLWLNEASFEKDEIGE